MLVLVCVLAYAAIALEHPLKVNKSASALLGAGLPPFMGILTGLGLLWLVGDLLQRGKDEGRSRCSSTRTCWPRSPAGSTPWWAAST